MKKVLATVAALGLVVGVTANALALDEPGRVSESEATTAPRVAAPTAPGVALWSVAGQWALAGAYVSKGMGRPGGAAIQSGGGTEPDSNDSIYYVVQFLPFGSDERYNSMESHKLLTEVAQEYLQAVG